MAQQFHPGTDIMIMDGVPGSDFRNAIPNVKRYMKTNNWQSTDVALTAWQGDVDKLEMLLATGDEHNLFNGDINEHVPKFTALHLAAQGGHAECIELLLKAKADVHMREIMPHGQDPEDGRTALDIANAMGWSDCAEILEQATKDQPYGWYMPAGALNNTKCYGGFEWGKKPEKGWYMSRPGAARKQGLDPAKFGSKDIEVGELDLLKAPGLTDGAGISKAKIKTLPVGLLLPGQGSEYLKMMSTVQNIPAVQEMLTKAKTILNVDIMKVCLEGPQEDLQKPSVCHPALFVAALAGIEKLRGEREEMVTRCQAMAGQSNGELAALCAAGVYSFEDGLRLVKLRAEAIAEAAKSTPQRQVSVAGLDRAKVVELCEEARKTGGQNAVCSVACELFPKGFICAGSDKAIDLLSESLQKAGAMQVKPLQNPAVHTALMRPAQQKYDEELDRLLPKMSPPQVTVYMTATAKPVRVGAKPEEVVQAMKAQLSNPMLWEQSVRAMLKDGVLDFYEVGPMKMLKSIMKRIDQKAWSRTQNVDV